MHLNIKFNRNSQFIASGFFLSPSMIRLRNISLRDTLTCGSEMVKQQKKAQSEEENS